MTYALILLTADLPILINIFRDLTSCMDAASRLNGICIGLSELGKLNVEGIPL